MAKKKEDLIHKSKEPHKLPCKLNPVQKAEAAEQLANAVGQAESLELERKTIAKDFASRKEALVERIHNLSNMVKEGVEMRSIDCELQLNFSKLTAILTRLDTCEIIEERPLTEEEKQQEMF